MRSAFATFIQFGIAALVIAGVWWTFRSYEEEHPAPAEPPASPPAASTNDTAAADPGAGEPPRNGEASPARAGPPAAEAAAAASTPGEDPSLMAVLRQLEEGHGLSEVTRDDVSAFLEEKGRTAETLLTAMMLLNSDAGYLSEAATAFPGEPEVQLAVLAHDLLPNERAEWVRRFKESDPDNALASYFATENLFAEGRIDEGIRELAGSIDRDSYEDYSMLAWQNLEEFFLNHGDSAVVAKAKAFAATPLPHMRRITKLGKQLQTIHDNLGAAGQVAAAENVAALSLNLGNRLSQGDGSFLLISELVGLSIEASFLDRLDPEKDYLYLDRPVPEMKASVEAQKEEIKAIARDTQDLLSLDEARASAYFDRVKLFGERRANRWLRDQLAEN